MTQTWLNRSEVKGSEPPTGMTPCLGCDSVNIKNIVFAPDSKMPPPAALSNAASEEAGAREPRGALINTGLVARCPQCGWKVSSGFVIHPGG